MNDIINALFEFFGGCFLWWNVRQLYHDKQIKGVSIVSIVFFALWGGFNLWFYPSVGAHWSFIAGLNIVAANVVWICQILYYKHKGYGTYGI